MFVGFFLPETCHKEQKSLEVLGFGEILTPHLLEETTWCFSRDVDSKTVWYTWCVPMNYGIINANDEFQENFLIKPATWDLASTHISFEAVGTDRRGFATDSYETGGLSTNGEDFFEAIASFVGALAELCVAQPVLFEGPSASTSVASVRPPFQVHSFEEWKESSQSMVSMNTDITSAFGLIEEKKSGEMFPFLNLFEGWSMSPWPFLLKSPLVSLKELFPSNLPQLQEALRYKPHFVSNTPDSKILKISKGRGICDTTTPNNPTSQETRDLPPVHHKLVNILSIKNWMGPYQRTPK